MAEPKILFYDIETTYLMARVWRCGDQVVRHDQLVGGHDQYRIICIAYAWNDGQPAKVLGWGRFKQDSTQLIEKFDSIINQADIVIGKNSDRFDNKHVNTLRWLGGLEGMPDWIRRTDDLEKQIRKHFYLPSNSLDYISKIRGLGGKRKMEFQDWVDIVEKKDKKAYDKMLDYCCKDVEDTRSLWNDVASHITPKFNHSAFNKEIVCSNCGSDNIKKNGKRLVGTTWKQAYYCNAHGGFAGYRSISTWTNKELGNLK